MASQDFNPPPGRCHSFRSGVGNQPRHRFLDGRCHVHKESSMKRHLNRLLDMLLDALERILKHIEAWIFLGISG